jgi:DNA primase
MATFPSHFIDELRRRVSLSDALSRYTTLQRRGSKIVGCCPFHKEKTPSFYVYEEHYHCYGCKAHGDVFTLLMDKKGLTFPEIVEELAKQCGMALPAAVDTDKDGIAREQRELYYEIMEQAAQFYQNKLASQEGKAAKHYITERGITSATITQFRIGYAPSGNKLRDYLRKAGYKDKDLLALQLIRASERDTGNCYDFFRDRLIFTICDSKGRVIGFGGRILGTGEPKYLNSPETPLFHKGTVVYGYHQAKSVAREQPTLCVEGYMDVVALSQAGFQAAVAPLGTSVTESQLRLLWRLNLEPIICLDGDQAGQNAALRVLEVALPVIQSGYSLRFVTLPEGEDPDSFVRSGRSAGLRQMIDNAQPLIDRLWHAVFASAPLKTPEQQAAIEKKIFDLVGKIKEPTLKKSYQAELLARHKKRIWQERTGKAGYGPTIQKLPIAAPADARAQQIKVLLVALLNHPYIIEELEHEFLELDLDGQACNKLREEIMQYIIEGNPLEKSHLNNYLCAKGYQDTLEGICHERVYAHARFALPEADPVDVVRDWRKLWWFCQGRQSLEQQIQQAQERFIANPTNENSAFLRRMQQEREKFKNWA